MENLSGLAMDDVRVQYNSGKPAQLNAHAYTQGTEIHVAPGQEKHLPHEAWHVVQQKEGRVQPTVQMKDGVQVNDDGGLEREADVMGARADSVGGVQTKSIESDRNHRTGMSNSKTDILDIGTNFKKTDTIQRVQIHTGALYSGVKDNVYIFDSMGGCAAVLLIYKNATGTDQVLAFHCDGGAGRDGGVNFKGEVDKIKNYSYKPPAAGTEAAIKVWNRVNANDGAEEEKHSGRNTGHQIERVTPDTTQHKLVGEYQCVIVEPTTGAQEHKWLYTYIRYKMREKGYGETSSIKVVTYDPQTPRTVSIDEKLSVQVSGG